ncbi:LysR substrate-binding domain-containing protein [Hydrogenophaga sp. BPS33]|uniref:LysR substrate-binding domain-containing protein n=1 Tax=Hydrogenophaga sp. BPS33 TaxID=2651974 RepID=UPI00131F73F0|nr:LysR substrate-binding domain-containing protein [Hydrogenophaga sp. BPS33]QHE87789.1 LysR family transcriptional regulator [Hydrogenophaga sp. BPS33]
MELRHLRYFVTVAELGSISRAAAKLYIAQPPLSAQIRQLEEEVGAALLVRWSRGVRLTPAGSSFLDDARAILARAEQATQRAREFQSGERSTLRVGLVPSATQSLLPGLLRRFVASNLSVQIEAQERVPSARQLQALRNAELDLGFVRPASVVGQSEWVCAIDDPYWVALPHGHALARSTKPIAVKALEHAVFVAFSRYAESDFFDQTASLCEGAGFKPDVRHTATQFMSVLAMVSSGLGVAIVPASCAILAQPGVAMRRLTGIARKSQLVLIANQALREDAWGRSVLQIAEQELRALEVSVRAASVAAR